jgi:hypothetical protein
VFACLALIIAVGCGTSSLPHSTQPATQVQVAISPASLTLSPGAQQQFTATVSGTSKTSVSWSSSAGSISSDGIFTAPSASNGTQITITATVSDSTQPATSVVTVQRALQLTITTSSLSGAIAGTAYDGSLSASGGTPPYHWTISAGSLAPGLRLQTTTGQLAGTISQQGQFPFTAKVTDAMSNSATQSLTLAVSHSSSNGTGVGGACGAPNYCSSTATANPGAISALFTGTTGVNLTAFDTTYNPAPLDCYTRATDATTWGGSSTDNNTFSGGDNDIMWSKLSTYVGVESGGEVYLLHLDLTGNCGKVVNTGDLNHTGGIHVAGPFGFSKVTDNIFYYLTNFTQINEATITSDKTYQSSLLVDVASGTTCPGLPYPFGATHGGILGIKYDDSRFGWVLSNTGGQGTGVWAVVWDRSLGCAVANMSTGSYWAFCTSECTPSTRPTGTLASSAACTDGKNCNCWGGPIHDSQMSGDGTALVITEYGVWTHGACAGNKLGTMYSIWEPGTQYTEYCNSAPGTASGGQYCGGHDSVGISSMLNSQLTVTSIRSLSDVANYTQFDAGLQFEGAHGQWPHPNNDDTYPWVQASYDLMPNQGTGCAKGANYCPITGGNAIFADQPASPLGQERIYFGHTFSCNTTSSSWAQCGGTGDHYFGCANGIMSVSQDGNWAMIGSGMLSSLGTDSKGYPRCDSFLVHLR